MELGDFTTLAKKYADSRPDYSSGVLNALIGVIDKPAETIKFADVGAGTGIWTNMVASKGVASVYAVEPNFEMRKNGETAQAHSDIIWIEGSAEHTNLQTACVDWVSMASSFHWADFDLALKEFHRILNPGGKFTALWNPRIIEGNQILEEIESKLTELKQGLERVSSGNSAFTNALSNTLSQTKFFNDVIYIEGRHVVTMSTERYLNAWRSVNDLQSQLGDAKFADFLNFVKEKTSDLEYIHAEYLTRSWTATKC